MIERGYILVAIEYHQRPFCSVAIRLASLNLVKDIGNSNEFKDKAFASEVRSRAFFAVLTSTQLTSHAGECDRSTRQLVCFSNFFFIN
jgi:hypothetical protein